MAAIFGADWADLWSFHHESSHLLSDVLVCLFCFSISICNQVRKHLEDLGGPQYIDERTFHHFIKDSGFGIGSMFGEVSRRVFVKVCLMLLPFP